LELRNRIYGNLWRNRKPLTMYQLSSKTEIVAFLDADKVKAKDQDFTRHRSFKDAERRSNGARNATK